jgi:hypothetical protein
MTAVPEIRWSRTRIMPRKRPRYELIMPKKGCKDLRSEQDRLKYKHKLDIGRKETKPTQGNWVAKKADQPTRKKQSI